MLKVKTIYDNREEFCAALRSGKYIQVVGGPSHWHGNKVCALGVANEEKIISYTATASEFRALLGLSCVDIAVMNDDGKTFAEIADWIEQQP